MELNRPIKPTPAGPRRTAITLVRIIPQKIVTTDDPPIIAVDFRICAWLDWADSSREADVVTAGIETSELAEVVVIGSVAIALFSPERTVLAIERILARERGA